MKKKEELLEQHHISIRKQLGKTFDRERDTKKRLKEETEFDKTNKASANLAYLGVLAKKTQLEKHLE